MLLTSTKWFAPILAVLALAAVQAPSAQAGFTLTILEDGVDYFGPITNPGAFVTPTDPGTISVDVTTINPLLQFFTFNTLSVTTNSFTGTPGSFQQARLFQTGNVSLNTGVVGNHTLRVIAADDGYTFPVGNARVMTTSASNTFQNGIATNRTFQSKFFDGTNTVTSGIQSFTPTPGTLSPSQPDLHNNVPGSITPFSLTNTSVITLGPGSLVVGFSGTTLLDAVPEPGSMSLGLISLPALLALGRRMRRRTEV